MVEDLSRDRVCYIGLPRRSDGGIHFISGDCRRVEV
jgi:hypothetical protein